MIYDIIYASPTSGNLLLHRRVVSIFHSDRFTPSAVAGYLVTFSRQCQASLGRYPTCLRMSRYSISVKQTDYVLAAIIHDPEDTEAFTLSVCESLVSLFYENLQRFFSGRGRSHSDLCSVVFLRSYRQYVGGAVVRLLGQVDALPCVERCCVSLGDQGLTRLFGRAVLTPPRTGVFGGRPGGAGDYLGLRGSPLDSSLVLGDRTATLFEAGSDLLPTLARRGFPPGFLATVDIRLGPERRFRAYSLSLRTLLIVVYGRQDAGQAYGAQRSWRSSRVVSDAASYRGTAEREFDMLVGSAPATGPGRGLGAGARPLSTAIVSNEARLSGDDEVLAEAEPGRSTARSCQSRARNDSEFTAPTGEASEKVPTGVSGETASETRGETPVDTVVEIWSGPNPATRQPTPQRPALRQEWDATEQKVLALAHAINEVLDIVSNLK